jgi:hypothetical protein
MANKGRWSRVGLTGITGRLMGPNSAGRYFISFFLFLITYSSRAWVYPEHRRIGLIAIQELPEDYRAFLNQLWSEARKGYEKRLSEAVILPDQGRHPGQLDYASWFAIGGDHSCSPQNLLYNVLETEWILEVADIAARLQTEIDGSQSAAKHINAIHLSDIRLQRADPDYANRAGANNVHFLLARPNIQTTAKKYLEACYAQGAELNALGTYAWFHTSALLKISRYKQGNLSAEQKSALILAALADEAFALHFLEDAFASGHVAGTWGSTSVRKGTHDYYNEKGLEVVTWEGNRLIIMGDAYMRPEDAKLAAVSVEMSLEQLLDVVSGKIKLSMEAPSTDDQADSFNVCRQTINLPRQYEENLVMSVLIKTPVPGLATGLGELPRFRAEIGQFFGISSSLNGTSVFGGFASNQKETGGILSIEANIRWGFGLEGVLNSSGDGLIFVQAGWKLNSSSTSQFAPLDPSQVSGKLTAAIPGRTGYNLRLRCPFWLVPGDLLIAAPVLLLFSPSSLTKMGVAASNGGLLPYESGIETKIGRFQFVAGREFGITFYGLSSPKDELFVYNNTYTDLYLLQYKSTEYDFPFLEYRPFRTFSLDQASSLIVQFSTGFDIPYGEKIISSTPPNAPMPTTKTVWHLTTRITFNWRHYY